MEKDKVTPEEKLLHLIENPTSKTKKQFKPPFKRKGPFKLSRLSRVIKEFWLKRRVKILTLKFTNKVLIGLSIIVTLFIVFDFIVGNRDVRGLYLIEKGLLPSELKADKIAESLPLSDYLDEIKRRDIFVSIEKEFPTYEEGEEITLASLAESLVLVGILWSDVPQVMIEDTILNKTYILNEGDSINNILIKDILKDRVILSYQGEEMEMM